MDLSGSPRLATGSADTETGGLDLSRINQDDAVTTAVGFAAVLENEPATFSISPRELKQNMAELYNVNAADNESVETAKISFQDADLKYVVKQLLGGLLSANYIIADDVKGTVSFTTETPVPYSAMPSIVRSILARSGYVLKVIDGVYQIGSPQAIAELELNAAVGTSGDYETRVIKIKGGNLNEIAAVAAQILPAGATVTPVPSSDSLILKLNPVDEKPVMDLLLALVDNTRGGDIVAVLPLRESPPETVAASLSAYFSQSGQSAQDVPLIIPLEEQQALLIVAQNEYTMGNARTLVEGLDKDNRDLPSVRIIALKNLPANEIADQLNKIFAANNGAANSTSNDTQAETTPSNDEGVEGGDSVTAPPTIRDVPTTDNVSPTAARFEAIQELKARMNIPVETARQVSEGISIVPDPRNNALLVFATFRQFKRIREVVQTLDVPLAQVVIEATIVEVTLNDNLKYGVQAFLSGHGLSLRSSSLPEPTDTGEAGGVAALDIQAVGGMTASLVLEALQTVTDVKIISSPYLTVLDGRAARLSVGDQIPFLVQQTSADQTGTTTTTNQIDVRDVGIILEVTPSIRADNSVLLKVQQEVSSAQASGSGETLTPTISQRAINSEVVVQSGRPVLLGGLIQDRSEKTMSGVPGLSKIPVIGKMFQQTGSVQARTELLVMITPRVVRRSLQLDSITQELRAHSIISKN
ncbi:type II and III secretion system protein [Rhizobium sp. PDO1-076]|nr:type II and III secretion system protein [Rhizobium sp. PDO1-076]